MTPRAIYPSSGSRKRGTAIPPQAAGGAIPFHLQKMGHRFLSALTQQENLTSGSEHALSENFRRQADGHHEVQSFRDLGPQQKPQTPLQCPLTRAQEDHVVPALQGAAAEVQRPLHAHPQGRRGPGGSRTLQRPANWQGGPGVQKEVRHLH